LGVVSGAAFLVVASLMDLHFRSDPVDMYDYLVLIVGHWLFLTVVPLSVMMVLLDPELEPSFQLRRPLIFGSIGISSTVLLILGISGWNEHTKSFIVSYPLNFSIAIRLMKCYESYYERYRRMLYFLQMTPWSTVNKEELLETFGLLPTFHLQSKRNIVAWNKMRIFLERFEVQESHRRQHAVVYMLGAWVWIAIYQAIKFFNPTTSTIDTAAFFVFANTVQLTIGLSLILYFGNLINELQGTGMEHMLRVKQAEMMSKRINFLVEHSWTSIHGRSTDGDLLRPELRGAERSKQQAEVRRWWREHYSPEECRHLDMTLPLQKSNNRAGNCDQLAVNEADDRMKRTSAGPVVVDSDEADELVGAEVGLCELLKIARTRGVNLDAIDIALDADEPEEEIRERINEVTAKRKTDREQLRQMRLSKLRKYAVQMGVSADAVDGALNGDKEGRHDRVIELIKEPDRTTMIHEHVDGTESWNGPPLEYCLLDNLIETIKNEHGFGARNHWGGEDRRAKLAFIYMDHRALMTFWSSVLAVVAPAIYQAVTSVFAQDSDDVAEVMLHQNCSVHNGPAAASNITAQIDVLKCYSEHIFLKLVEHDPSLVNQN
jgi:hypothetical protein